VYPKGPMGTLIAGAIMSEFEPNAFAFSPGDAARYSSLGLTGIKTLLRTGVLPFHKGGRRTLVLRSDLEAYLSGLGAKVPKVSCRPRGARGRFAS
jgi:excisionase family DNA binding protein